MAIYIISAVTMTLTTAASMLTLWHENGLRAVILAMVAIASMLIFAMGITFSILEKDIEEEGDDDV